MYFVMYILQLYWFTKILAGILESVGFDDLTYNYIEEDSDEEEEEPVQNGKKVKTN
mgnify:CR=1 FL=1